MNLVKAAITTLILVTALPVSAKHLHNENWYQDQWCEAQSGRTEVVLPDRTRADCLTHDHAIEFDFANKWSESIGQSLYYSIQTGKRAGIVLIMEKKSDYKYWLRLNSVIENYELPIDTWSVGGGIKSK